LISKKQEQDEKNSSLAESNVFFFQISIFKKSEKKEGGEGERERKSGGGGGAKGSIAHIHTHTERERENERGDVRLFYDKNFVRFVVSYNCPSSTRHVTSHNFLEK